MTYTLKMLSRLVLPGKQLKNIGGHIVAFHYGVAIGVSEEIAAEAPRYKFIEKVIPELVDETPEETSEPVEEATPEEEETSESPEEVSESAEETSEPLSEGEDTAEPEEASDTEEVPDTEEEAPDTEEEAPKITAEDIAALYAEYGKWKDVASHLNMTTAQLRDLRRELGVD